MIDKENFIEQVVVPRQRALRSTAVEENKRLRSKELADEVAEFLKAGGQIEVIKRFVPAKTKFNDRNTTSILDNGEVATVSEISALKDWVREKRGRGLALTKEVGKAVGYISQIIRYIKPCSKQQYQEIMEAKARIEQREKAS